MGFKITKIDQRVGGLVDLTVELEDGSIFEVEVFEIKEATAVMSGRMSRITLSGTGVLTKVYPVGKAAK